jgi:hypothetical protein
VGEAIGFQEKEVEIVVAEVVSIAQLALIGAVVIAVDFWRFSAVSVVRIPQAQVVMDQQ